MNANFVPFMRSVWPQKLLLMLWVKNGSVMWSKSLVGTTNKVSHESGCLYPWPCPSATKGQSCYRRRKTGEKKDIPEVTDTTEPRRLGTKIAKIRKLFNLSREDHVHQRVVRKPLNKEEYAKLLAKRMKEAKEKCQEETTKRGRLSPLKASTSESSQK
eukprot:bmy_15200T0